MAENMDRNGYMTDSLGRPVPDDKNSLTAGENGPVLLEDVYFLDKLAHFDRERIPERVVHAKGAGAYGVFQSFHDLRKYTMADFLNAQGKKTRVFVRFSTVIGSKGSPDTVRDPRGFAVKFYTGQGNYDIVGNHLPVFFIRDAIRFPDVIHALKPSPDTNIQNPERFWDFISLTPESTHMITWLYSDLGTIKDYRHIDGFGVNTYVWINAEGKRKLIKYHWKCLQGVEYIDRKEATYLAGEAPDIATHKLYDAIAEGNYPAWNLCVQMMEEEEAEKLPFDPLDDTKIWPEDCFPLYPIGRMTLNENPKNFFAETEQAAFCPANIVPGIRLSADKMLQGRGFSYTDTQRHRLGPNFMQLPINRPVSSVDNNQRDGNMTYLVNEEPINYSPNSLNRNRPVPANIPTYPVPYKSGVYERKSITKTDDFTQAGEHYESLSRMEKAHLAENIAVELKYCNKDIQKRVLDNLGKASSELAFQIKKDMS